jgi:hypothetical protein
MDMPYIFSLLHGNDDLNYLTNHLLGQIVERWNAKHEHCMIA